MYSVQSRTVRIKGLIATTNRVREQLKVGVPPEKVPHFQQYIRETISTVEHLCASHRIRPQQLPAPSRKAYTYLKQLDLKKLPIAKQETNGKLAQTIHLRNIRVRQFTIHSQIEQIALKFPLSIITIQKLHQKLEQTATEIEQICTQAELTSAHLTGQSKTFYDWLKFLIKENHLQTHIEATQQVHKRIPIVSERVASPTSQKRKTISTQFNVNFFPLNGLYKYRSTDKVTELQLHEGFIGAETTVIDALLQDILFGKSKTATEIIKRYSLSPDFNTILTALEQNSDNAAIASQGHAYNLESMFHTINKTYFQGTMEMPQLSWNKTFTHRKFGHYEPARDRIEISMTLDNPKVPAYVVEFVLYHELLHKHHKETWSNGRRMVHTTAFRKDEKLFKSYEKAETWLTKLARA